MIKRIKKDIKELVDPCMVIFILVLIIAFVVGLLPHFIESFKKSELSVSDIETYYDVEEDFLKVYTKDHTEKFKVIISDTKTGKKLAEHFLYLIPVDNEFKFSVYNTSKEVQNINIMIVSPQILNDSEKVEYSINNTSMTSSDSSFEFNFFIPAIETVDFNLKYNIYND